MRGDDAGLMKALARYAGGPPRARGRLLRGLQPALDGGRTPACAGTTCRPAAGSSCRPEDPRVRGDDVRAAAPRGVSGGGPPRARGRHHPVSAPAGEAGRTPACAGTTPASPTAPTSGPEDPRVRGDDGRVCAGAAAAIGGPPRARGRPVQSQEVGQGRWRTPACAGTTTAVSVSYRREAEDPRVRGDDAVSVLATAASDGGPPRARGRRRRRRRARGRRRRTPACAGTTSGRTGRRRWSPEDPRVRGDDAC